MKYTIKVSRPLDSDANEAMFVALPPDVDEHLDEIMPQLLEKIARSSESMDQLIVEVVGRPPKDAGAGFGQRDLIWYDLEWEFAADAAKKLLDLTGADIIVSITAMRRQDDGS